MPVGCVANAISAVGKPLEFCDSGGRATVGAPTLATVGVPTLATVGAPTPATVGAPTLATSSHRRDSASRTGCSGASSVVRDRWRTHACDRWRTHACDRWRTNACDRWRTHAAQAGRVREDKLSTNTGPNPQTEHQQPINKRTTHLLRRRQNEESILASDVNQHSNQRDGPRTGGILSPEAAI